MDTAPFIEIRVTQQFSAPADRVFDAWLDRETAGNWLFATASRPAMRVTIDARVGGAFRVVERSGGMDVEYAGEYVEIARPRRLVFTLSGWKYSQNSARVTVGIVPQVAGCELTLTHDSVLPGHAGRVEGHWAGMLYGLATMLAL
jgi:uncharacterized protein YndB with AHSA1/START domain